ncbi:TatD family hydrolase [Bradyrhizobium sp. B117]|uniref:TatD family hydrolase n=1 Tax=Bradyrhizobium sp. B117 TaxID=3140246 RepID=UPI0031833C8E
MWDAEEDTLGILAEHPGAPFVLHSFTGTTAMAQSAVEKGGYVSFSGVITFKTSQEMRNLASQIARERIFIETDAPSLAPAPFHDKRNVPSPLPAHRGNPCQSAAGEPERSLGDQYSKDPPPLHPFADCLSSSMAGKSDGFSLFKSFIGTVDGLINGIKLDVAKRARTPHGKPAWPHRLSRPSHECRPRACSS